ncbi:MAG: hypothetical protein KDN22_09735 [Verrucomicrobiae bacterium]|nr:hypothetical protein [Verrucomicrobiae bacterium]
MKTCTALLTLLLLADTALTATATESLGLTVAVIGWLLLYPLLAGALPNARTGLRWLILFGGFGAGAIIDHLTDRGFHWLTGVTAVAAAGHYAGWTGAVGLLFGNSNRARLPTALGRPGCFNTSFAASILLAYLCQTDASGLGSRAGLIFGFLAAMLGFITWELGRSVEARPSTTGKTRTSGTKRIFRWLLAAGASVLAFLLFAQILPLAAEKATHVTSMQVTGDSFSIPDIPDLDNAEFRGGKFGTSQEKRPLPSGESEATAPIESVEGLSGGFSQDVAGGSPEGAARLQEFGPGTTTNTTSSGPIVDDAHLRPDSSPESEFAAGTVTAKPAPGSPDVAPGSAFWSLPPGLVWPVLLLAGLAVMAVALVVLLLRSKRDAEDSRGGNTATRRPMWDHAYIPAYLRDFLARAAELGFEKERGQTLREFLRSLRRRGVSNENLPKLSAYHYRVQFESARRNDTQERKFRREAGKWLH